MGGVPDALAADADYTRDVERLRAAIVSGDALARSGLGALLAGREDLAVACALPPAEATADALGALAVEAALWDAGPSGLAGLADLAAACPTVALVADEAQAAEALAAGARGVARRDAGADRLAAAMTAAARGLVTLDGALAPALVRPRAPPPGDAEGLTAREAEVLALLGEGLSNKAIAARLGVAERTAKFHVESILGKLGAESRSEAIVIAARRGLVSL
jgi:two-component system, NarL family, nitrate/nitrite response regulator NarL